MSRGDIPGGAKRGRVEEAEVALIRGRLLEQLAVHLERDAESRQAILHSHAACQETGEWPSDHGLEALSLTLKTPGTA